MPGMYEPMACERCQKRTSLWPTMKMEWLCEECAHTEGWESTYDKDKVCCLCGGPFEQKYGNNAKPLADGRCCDRCDFTKVIPERIRLALAATKPPGRKGLEDSGKRGG